MKIGLALSGGGIRGAAHIGAIKALEEVGLKDQINKKNTPRRSPQRAYIILFFNKLVSALTYFPGPSPDKYFGHCRA